MKKLLIILFKFLLIILGALEIAVAQQEQACKIAGLSSWTEPENWAWQQVCEGRIANFNRKYVELNPSKSAGWSNERVLRPQFLETILLREPFRSALPRPGVRVTGAWFTELINLSHARLDHPLEIRGSRFESDVVLAWLDSNGPFLMDGSKFLGKVTMTAVQMERQLYIRGSDLKELDLSGAKVFGQISLDGSKLSGSLSMDLLDVHSDLYMRNGIFNAAVISGVIGGDVRLNGSEFKGKVSMDPEVGGHLRMEGDTKFGELDLSGIKVRKFLLLDNAAVSEKLDMTAITVNGGVMMRNAKYSEAILAGATIDGSLIMDGSMSSGKLDMASMTVGGDLFMSSSDKNKAVFSDVDLSGAKIGSNLTAKQSLFYGSLMMDSMRVERHIHFVQTEFKKGLDLRNAKIGGQLTIEGSKLSGEVIMGLAEVGGGVYMTGTVFDAPVKSIFMKVGSNFDIRGSELTHLDLSGTRVGAELQFGGRKNVARWGKGAKVILRNVVVEILPNLPEAESLELGGFVYSHFGGYTVSTEASDITSHDARWFVDWLARDTSYESQPYAQLAKVFSAAGEIGKASNILYAGKERERKEAQGLRWLGLTLINYSTGYGYHYFYSCIWVTFLVGVGVVVLRVTGEGKRLQMPYGVAYSLDMLLPIVKLRNWHYEIDLAAPARYYFYFHSLMGYVLASFLIAGISGLTK